MSTVYVFRIDGAKDNDEFFGALRLSACHVYAGVDFRVGVSGWIPDLVKVVVEDRPGRCLFTLIELEAAESVALISCRKYLPERSADILAAFSDYLERVIRQCRSCADSRECEFAKLKVILANASNVTVTTAGALRSSADFVEELALIDQPRLVAQARPIQGEQKRRAPAFRGILRLSQEDAHALARCVMILDAVIRRQDHSGATFRGWRGGRHQPLKCFLNDSSGVYPALRAFILGAPNRGITLEFDKMLTELVEIWSAANQSALDREDTRNLVIDYFPIALPIKGHEQMAGVFETARKHVAEMAALRNEFGFGHRTPAERTKS